MSESRVYISKIDPGEYDLLYPDRLTIDEIEEKTPLALFLKTPGENFDAFRVSSSIEDVKRHMGAAVFKTIGLDRDFKPASRRVNSFMDADSNWTSPNFQLRSKSRRITIESGFIVPNPPDEFDLFLEESSKLKLPEDIFA